MPCRSWLPLTESQSLMPHTPTRPIPPHYYYYYYYYYCLYIYIYSLLARGIPVAVGPGGARRPAGQRLLQTFTPAMRSFLTRQRNQTAPTGPPNPCRVSHMTLTGYRYSLTCSCAGCSCSQRPRRRLDARVDEAFGRLVFCERLTGGASKVAHAPAPAPTAGPELQQHVSHRPTHASAVSAVPTTVGTMLFTRSRHEFRRTACAWNVVGVEGSPRRGQGMAGREQGMTGRRAPRDTAGTGSA